MQAAPLSVLIVDDSPVALAVLKRILQGAPDIDVVGTARDGKEALERVAELRPQVLCTDFHMPVMDGLELTRHVMDRFPTPILCVSVSVQADDRDTVFKLLEAGAVDVFPKPEGGLNALSAASQEELLAKIRILAGVRVVRRPWRGESTSATAHPGPTSPRVAPAGPSRVASPGDRPAAPTRIIALGASTGGPQVLQTILTPLPRDFPIPILCVQHISHGFLDGLVGWLNDHTALNVKIARPGEAPVPGTVYLPEENAHLEISSFGTLASSRKPRFAGVRPAVHYTFHSVAAYYSSAAVGVLLTGIGRDGAEGLLAIRQAGGFTLAQDEASCTVFGMPQCAIELGAAVHVLPPAAIAEILLKLRATPAARA